MATELTRTQWIEILLDENITHEVDLKILQALYGCEDHKAPGKVIGQLVGNTGKKPSSAVNSEIGRYAKRIGEYYEINLTVRENKKFKYWDLFFKGWHENSSFVWQLKPELKVALEETELTDEFQYPEEIPTDELNSFAEGLQKTIKVNTYERNPKARQKCIEHWKPICSVCDFDFEKMYGKLGSGFIHVHHLNPVSEVGQTYQINPINDLRPVCPNCHAMLHKKNPPLTIKALKEIIHKPKNYNIY